MNEQLKLHSAATVTEILRTIPQHALMGGQLPIQNCLELVIAHGCQSVILQDPIQDPDYLGEYQAFYSKLFVPVHRYCSRLHFFKIPPTTGEEVLQFLDRAHASPNSYIGFLTLRPIHWAPVGATFLPAMPKPSLDSVSTDRFPVHLGGCRFDTLATPFMQQDNAVGACAQAAIWMALRTLRARMGHSALDPAQITTAATRFLVTGRTNPGRDGLNFPQMIEAVRSAGHVPLPVEFHFAEQTSDDGRNEALADMRRKIYPYVESGIPTILILQAEGERDAHAVLAVGHQWNEKPQGLDLIHAFLPWREGETTVSILHAATWAPGFLVHNDNTGPYRTFSARGDDLDIPYAMEDLRYMLVPLPPDVLISAEEAELKALGLLQAVLKGAYGATKNPRYEPGRISDRLVLRPYLMERREFRRWARDEIQLPSRLKHLYRMLPLPKRLWVLELNLVEQYSEAPSLKGVRVGEILIDPSADIHGNLNLAMHINLTAAFGDPAATEQEGLVLYRSNWTKDPDITERIAPDSPYLPHVHKGP